MDRLVSCAIKSRCHCTDSVTQQPLAVTVNDTTVSFDSSFLYVAPGVDFSKVNSDSCVILCNDWGGTFADNYFRNGGASSGYLC